MDLPEELQTAYNKLTDKQQRFVDLWTGDATETSAMAGYSAPQQAGTRALKNAVVCRLIKYIRDETLKPQIMTRQERQKFYTDIALGKITEQVVDGKGKTVQRQAKLKDRLRAAELLSKSEGDFLERREISGGITIEQRLREIVSRKIARNNGN